MTCQYYRRDSGSPLRWTTLFAVAVVMRSATAAPQTLKVPETPKVPEPTTGDDVVYDQRQNGTENVRISLSDLKVVLAPADGLFEIMSLAGAQFLSSQLTSSSKFDSDAVAAEQYLNSQLQAADSSGHRPAGTECSGSKCNNRHRQASKKSAQ